MKKTALAALVLGSLFGTGCVATYPRRVVVVREYDYPAAQPAPTQSYDDWPAPTQGQVVVESEPPAARVEIITESPGDDYFWVGGVWVWRGGWVWAPGRWMYRRPGFTYYRGGWTARGHGWVYRSGGFRHR